MKDMTIAITAASYSGNKGAAAMLQSSIRQLSEIYGEKLHIELMSVYPSEDARQCPHEFVKIVSAKPEQLVFTAFPCAVLYRLLHWCPAFRILLLKNKILNAYSKTDLVLDEAGIAFADSRGFVMNTYAFICMAVPMLMGIPVVKYAQAFGPFQNVYNRFLAKWILPKAELVVARGKSSYDYLVSIGITKNVRMYADGAFTMPDSFKVEKAVKKACEKLGFSKTVGLSVSSVVERRCKKTGIDYCGIMVEFISYLVKRGYQVYMFANAARIHSKKPRNNDLMTGDAIYQAYEKQAGRKLIWEHREMDAEEVRAYIGHCQMLVASRFHAMVFALSKQVPVVLIGWSHKYEEVLQQFGLSEYAADYSRLSLPLLRQKFEEVEKNQAQIRKSIAAQLPTVQESSRQNICQVVKILESDRVQMRLHKGGINHVIDVCQPSQYFGPHITCRMGYAANASIRENAASGGMVTALLCSLLENHDIDGAWVVQTSFTKEGKLSYTTKIATTIQQVCEASSSVYMDIPMMSHIDQLRQFDGRLAVVLTPCMMRAFQHILERDKQLEKKIVLKIGLFCSGQASALAAEYAMDHCRIDRTGAKRLYYRRGHWRGKASVIYEDGSERDFSYKKTICAYKNAYFFMKESCLTCKDHFASLADISFGDVWLSEMKKEPVKYTGCVIRTKEAYRFIKRAEKQGDVYTRPMSDTQMLASQKRALTFKYRGEKWNHRLAGCLAEKNQRLSKRHPELLKRVPMSVVYYYMCLIRVLLSW